MTARLIFGRQAAPALNLLAHSIASSRFRNKKTPGYCLVTKILRPTVVLERKSPFHKKRGFRIPLRLLWGQRKYASTSRSSSREVKMRVWLLSIGEPLPYNGNQSRLWRSGHLADALSRKGHQVCWWTSTFDHKEKRHLSSKDTTWPFRTRCELRMLHAMSYSKNISWKRLVNHRQLGKKFLQQAAYLPRPDVIISSLPTLDFCSAASCYGRQFNVPVVLDLRDLWPDIFVDVAPALVRKPVRLMLSPFFRQIRKACSRATALTGITEAFVDWGLDKAGRTRSALDHAFPMGYSSCKPSSKEINDASLFWKTHGVTPDNGEFIVCFFGTLGRHFEASTVMETATNLAPLGTPIRFVICGTGEQANAWHRQGDRLANVTMPGWVNRAQIWSLMRMSSVALAPYISTHDFSRSLPNKSIEYLSAGLPVLSSLQGVLSELLQKEQCGITYENGNSQQLADILLSLPGDTRRCGTMSTNAKSLYRRQFVAEDIYDAMAEHLERVAQEKRVFAHAA